MDVDDPSQAQAAANPDDTEAADPEYLQQVLEGLPSNSPKKEVKSEPKSGGNNSKKK